MSLEEESVKEEDLMDDWCGDMEVTDEATELYAEHEIKEDLVIGPTSLQSADSTKLQITTADNHVENDTLETATKEPNSELHIPCDILQSQIKVVHTCGICKKQFISKEKLACHIKVHNKKKPCECTSLGACVQDIKERSLPKRALIEKGRCTPDLPILKNNQKLNSKMYNLHSWLTGCIHKNRLYCYYCLLFSNDKSSWARCGYVDIRNLPLAARRHEQSEKHIEASLKFSTFKKNRVETTFHSESPKEIANYNAKVDRNRNIFRRLIDIVCFLGNQEDFCGQDGFKNYSELIGFVAKYDGVLENYLLSPSSFSAVSSQVQMNLISSIASVIDDYIKQEINAADFVAVLLEETTDINGEEKLAVVLRYFHESKLYDRFIRYVDVCDSAEAVSDVVLQTLADYNCVAKVTAQTYDGAAAACGDRPGAAARLRRRCPRASHVWNSAHALNHVLAKSCQRIPEIKRFFGIIRSLVNFFHNDAKIQNHYNKMADLKQLPHIPDAHWTYDSRIVNTIFDASSCLIDLFEDMSKNGGPWDGDTLYQASCFLHNLKEFHFQFFLRVFARIFAETDELYNNMQNIKSDVDCGRIAEIRKKFELFLETLRTSFQEIFDEVKQIAGALECNVEGVNENLKRIFIVILIITSKECRNRFEMLNMLKFFQLLQCDNFAKYDNNWFPLGGIKELVSAFNEDFKFNTERLKKELRCIYKTVEFRNKDVYDLIDHFEEYDLNSVFPESLRLAKLIGTFPCVPSERSPSGLRRVLAHLSTPRRRLTDLSKIYLEQTLLTEIKRQPNFYDSVIKIYSEKDRRLDFTYKR